MKALHIFPGLVLFFSILCFNSFSQQPHFTPVPPPPEGWGPIVSGVQDSKGYMWFAGSGVIRYDGYNYKSYYNKPQDPFSLAYNQVSAICADSKGFIWIGTSRKGLDRLDPETGIFTHYRQISNDTISAIIEDRTGKIWVGTNGGLNCLDPGTGLIQLFKNDPNDPNTLSYDHVTALYKDSHGTIWVGTGFLVHEGLPLNKLRIKEGGLNRFNPGKNNFTRFSHDPHEPTSLIDNRVTAIYEDSKGRFWVGTAGDGLHTMNREKGTFERHQYNPANPAALSRPPVNNSLSWKDDMITFIREDAIGAIWIGTLTGGLNRYDPRSGRVSFYPTLQEKLINKSGFSNLILGCAVSKDGVLWITGHKEVFYLDPLQQTIPYYDARRSVHTLLQDTIGRLWLGSDDGLTVYNSSWNRSDMVLNTFSEKPILKGVSVNSMVNDVQGNLWIASNKGLKRYEQSSKKITSFLDHYDISGIYEDTDGALWLATNSGLRILNKQGVILASYLKDKNDTTSLSQNRLWSITEDKTGSIWVSTTDGGGLDRFDRSTRTFRHYLPGTSYHSHFIDVDSVLWIGTEKGLYYFNPAKDKFEIFTNDAAGLTENINILQIVQDNDHALWLNNGDGFFKISHDRNDVRFYGKKYGIIEFNWATQKSCFKGKDGKLFFGLHSGTGFFAFYPELLKGNSTPPSLHISAFSLGDQVVKPGTQSPLKLPLSQANEIHLNYDQNVFSFDFAGIHYSDPDGNRHLFKLENFDNDWRRANDERKAYYSSVPPGKYVFRVKAASSNGVWAEKEIAIIISPPWWETWWAYCIYGLLLMTSILVLHRIQKKRVVEKERERTRDRELAQAKEIEKAYTELKSTQAQLIQSEKMASLGELTAGIAHEIQNPLNFVNNFSEVNNELLAEMQDEITKGNFDEVSGLARDIKDNQDKINEHGKRAESIVKGMLLHSRSASGVKELTDINKQADEYLRLSYHGFRAKDKTFNAEIKTDYDPSVGSLNVVPQEIGRVLLNLFNNGFYSVNEKKIQQQDGYEPTISVSTKRTNDKVIITVKDNGNGIPQKVIDKIFQPFFTTKPTGQGTGLGLSLAYDIIKAHGGEIKVETKEGDGSEFIVYLPFTQNI